MIRCDFFEVLKDTVSTIGIRWFSSGWFCASADHRHGRHEPDQHLLTAQAAIDAANGRDHEDALVRSAASSSWDGCSRGDLSPASSSCVGDPWSQNWEDRS